MSFDLFVYDSKVYFLHKPTYFYESKVDIFTDTFDSFETFYCVQASLCIKSQEKVSE